MTSFKIGSVVKLASGGPDMSVTKVRSDGYIICTWYDRNSGYYERYFVPEILIKVESKPNEVKD